ncbi:MAG: Superfamily II DNA/RNA helicase [Candidatus Rifleibacterium amylolyticum]|nr:MAG: Superfamily II DNA/RNA helicase [Candidatus Rifleibacterium amylolyticum]
MMPNTISTRTRAEKSPLIKVESRGEQSFTFQIKGKAFQQGYLFLNPQMKEFFPFSDDLSSITFIDDDEVVHSAIYHKMRGYMVCLTFNEWWTKKGVNEGDSVSIELIDQSRRTYRLRLLNGCEVEPVGNQDNIDIRISSFVDQSISYSSHNLEVLRKIVKGEFSPYRETSLVQLGEELAAGTSVEDELMSLQTCFGVNTYFHQIQTARTVIEKLNGRALLADEVGLGKTIEAGLILKEYLLRGMVRKVLILTPASLITQWQQELKTKFDLSFKNHLEISDWDDSDLVIASLDTAKSQKNQNTVQQIKYDLLIVDEAHKLKNKKTKNWKFVNSINTKYLLMLTATPIQNDMIELFNLISILKPGHLSTVQKFKDDFLAERDKRLPKNSVKLRQMLSEIMIRHRRADTLIKFPQRFVHTHSIDLNADEAELYRELTDFIRKRYFTLPTHKNPRGINRLTLILLQKLMGSSTQALAKALGKMISSNFYKDDFDQNLKKLYDMAKNIKSSRKGQVMMEIVRSLNEKVIIFTQFRGTQDYIVDMLRSEGYSVAVFNGQMSQVEKDRCIEDFRNEKQILVSTESGGEGRNLQFCKILVNFDLPWNPMRIEQRIGRIHRLGQNEDVHIINLSAKDTIESYVLELLDKKINLFRLIIGELEMILGNMHSKRTLEQIIIDIVTMSPNQDAMRRKFKTLGNKLEKALQTHNEINKAQEEIFNGE